MIMVTGKNKKFYHILHMVKWVISGFSVVGMLLAYHEVRL